MTSRLLLFCCLFAPATLLGAEKENPCAHKKKTCATQCDDGNAQACLDLARVYIADTTAKKGANDARVTELLEGACEEKLFPACFELGRQQVAGRAAGSWKGALKSFKKACKGGVPDACEQAGDLLVTGNAGKRDEDGGVAAYEEACAAGVLTACSKAGGYACGYDGEEKKCKTLIEKGCKAPAGCGDLIQVPKSAAAIYQGFCDENLAPACHKAGQLYVKLNAAPLASKAFGKACKADIAAACTGKGVLLLGGKGIEKDEEKGVQLLQKGCDGKDPAGCRELGLVYLAGKAVDEDGPRGAALLKQACAAKDAAACVSIGWRMFNGDGVPKDVEGGKELMHQSCQLGNATGCNHLQNALWEEKRSADDEGDEEPRPRKKKAKRKAEEDE